MIVEVTLEGLEFYAFHGIYDGERKMGNKFTVDVKVLYEYAPENNKEDLSKTIDYEKICNCVKQEMAKPAKLLETLAINILERIFSINNNIQYTEVHVSKHNPPVGGQCKRAMVSLRKHKDVN
ncbi:MAG: dihydroneopterin aldolase [Cytophagaceae bacterium]|nr:dihydroneopterin aldolase [Cytophagaceae bacterium]MDW8455485.1 dihydroneopterin aldolase [Cytophagaceae bacterium]